MKLLVVQALALLAIFGSASAKPSNAGTCSTEQEGYTYGIASDCKKYFLCKKGVLQIKECEKKNYDTVTGKCVKVGQATCAVETAPEPEPQPEPVPEPVPELEENDAQYDYLCAKVLYGVRVHPTACDRYLVCNKEKATIETCAEGFIFLADSISCQPGNTVTCEVEQDEPTTTEYATLEPEPTFPSTEESGSGEESSQNPGSGEESSENPGTYDYLCAKTLLGSVAHPETCTKYISCFNKKATEQSCKKGYGYSSKLHLCIKQKNGACPDVTDQPTTVDTPTEPEPEPTFPSTEESGSGEESSQNPGSGENSSENPGTYDYLCAKTLLGSVAHPETCTKYISCFNKKASEQSCKKGYGYSSKLHLCIKQKNGACPDVTEDQPTTVDTPTEPEPEPTFPSTQESGSGEESSQNPGSGEESSENPGTYDYLCAKTLLGSVAHPETCTKYISCFNKKASEQSCKKGYGYSSKLHLCIKQKNGACPDVTEDQPTTVDTPTEPEPEPTFPSTEESGSGEESSQNPGSEEESSENPGTYDYLCAKTLLGSVAHPETCTKYISCFNKKATEQSCKKGYGYSSKLYLCIKQKNGACPDVTEDQPTTVDTPTEPEPEPTFPSTEESGSGEESSQNPGSEEESSENPGTYDYLCAKTLLGSVAHPETCTKYISCFNKKASEQSCKKGYGYSSKLHLCIKQKNGACPDVTEDQPTTVDTPTEPEPEPTFPSTEESGSGEESSQNPGSEEESSENPGTYDYLCAKTLLGSVAHPETCTKYISCFNKKATEQSCKKGYGFSSKLHLCIKQKNGACPDVTEEQPTTEGTTCKPEPEPTFSSTLEPGSGEQSSTQDTTFDSQPTFTTTQATEPEPTFPTTSETEPETPGQYDYVCDNVYYGVRSHPDSCIKYIICSNYKAKEEVCKDGYYFSVYLQSCIKGNSETCADINGNTGASSESPPAITTEAFPPATGGDPGEVSTGCVEGFTGYLPIENDCTIYVYCYQGEPGVRACLDDYIYYDPFKACLPGDPVSCKLYSV